MRDLLIGLAESFGFSNPTFKLDERSQRRILWTSLLPMLVVAAALTQAGLLIAFHPGAPGEDEAFWLRVWLVSGVLDNAALAPALALLFASGLRRWSLGEGTRAFFIGCALAFAALALSSAAAIFWGFLDLEAADDLYARVWSFMAAPLGFLAVGYFFVAYRSVARTPRAPRPRWQPHWRRWT